MYNAALTVFTVNTGSVNGNSSKIPRRRITVTSSFQLNIHSMDQLGNVVAYSARPHRFLQQASGQIFNDDVNGLSSTSDNSFLRRYDMNGRS
jgi:hypothetical protein